MSWDQLYVVIILAAVLFGIYQAKKRVKRSKEVFDKNIEANNKVIIAADKIASNMSHETQQATICDIKEALSDYKIRRTDRFDTYEELINEFVLLNAEKGNEREYLLENKGKIAKLAKNDFVDFDYDVLDFQKWLFEKHGWPETTIVVRFWIIAILLAFVGLATLKLR